MTCREEVISNLETVYQWVTVDIKFAGGLPERDYEIMAGWISNAIALLKEQEAKTGHWIDTTKVIGFPRCECSECNSEAGASWMKYCPNCGAKMEGLVKQ